MLCVFIDGGIDEVVDEMSGGKTLYAFMRVIDANTQLPKNVLINWVCHVGEADVFCDHIW